MHILIPDASPAIKTKQPKTFRNHDHVKVRFDKDKTTRPSTASPY
jgi:hypothetical protein